MKANSMPYSKIVNSYDGAAKLKGCTVTALHSEYSFASLLLDSGEVINFAVEEVSVGKWFEVFPICLHRVHEDCAFDWRVLEVPFVVVSIELLWREEWQESSLGSGLFMGSGPHSVQHAARLGGAPESHGNVVKVLAGIRLAARDGRHLVVSSSGNSPFKIDLAMGALEIEQLMQSLTSGSI